MAETTVGKTKNSSRSDRTLKASLTLAVVFFSVVVFTWQIFIPFMRRMKRTYDFPAEQMTVERLSLLGFEVEHFHEDCGVYPSTSQGFGSFVAKPDDLNCPAYKKEGYHAGYSLKLWKKMERDGWGVPMKYLSNGNHYRIEASQGHALEGPPPEAE